MRVMATFLYPDLSLKKKHNHVQSKKANKDSEKSFAECLLSINNQFNQENKKESKCNSLRKNNTY